MKHRTALAGCILASLAAATSIVAVPRVADAFCGFYVSGADAEMFNDATTVVMMREGTRTVLSMQNTYTGPPEDFAMVVPVPVVLQEDNVRTLPSATFDRVDQMSAPRLVEYWERDPCEPEQDFRSRPALMMSGDLSGRDSGVVVEATFTVAEYDVVMLSADDATSLETWLLANEYRIPEGAEEQFRPYIEQGQYFFVARVSVDRLTFDDAGRVVLSPLRFHYDAETFSLPIRLGLINASGEQDLIVHILSVDQRYELANYDNVTIPTNIELHSEALDDFAEFYVALFDRTLEENPGAIVTEYAWNASTCDPCPGSQLTQQDFLTLGGDVVPSNGTGSYVLTRLHARYDEDSLGEDLVFRAADPIEGGRQVLDEDGALNLGATESNTNNFQGRYAVRHRWDGPVECENPIDERWGRRWEGAEWRGDTTVRDSATADRDAANLEAIVAQDVPAIDVEANEAAQ